MLLLPALTLVPPIAGVLIGVVLFGEDLHVTVLTGLVEALSVVLATAGVVALGRSPLAETAYSPADAGTIT